LQPVSRDLPLICIGGVLLILTYEENFENVRKTVLSRIDIGNEVSDGGIKETIEEALGEYCREFYVPLAQRQSIYNELFYQLRALDILQELVENPEVTDVKHAILIQGRTSKSLEIRGFCDFIYKK